MHIVYLNKKLIFLEKSIVFQQWELNFEWRFEVLEATFSNMWSIHQSMHWRLPENYQLL